MVGAGSQDARKSPPLPPRRFSAALMADLDPWLARSVDLSIPFVDKVMSGQSGAFINTEVNTSLDTIAVRVARHQETTLDARTSE